MPINATIENCEPIPHPPEWYALEPFDPTLVFRDNEGRVHRYLNSPLDERYAAEPGDSYPAGSLPPEEREVRDTLLVAVTLRNKVSRLDFWWSQFIKPTNSYLVSQEYFQKLQALCGRSREYRAAFCRLANSANIVPGLRRELKRIVELCDQPAN